MKIINLLSKIDRLKPNTVEGEDKFEWINELEGIIYKNIFARAADTTFNFAKYDFDADQETELLVPFPFDDIYFHYLSAKIDYTEGEINSYNNNMSLYNTMYEEFAADYRRNHIPKRGY